MERGHLFMRYEPGAVPEYQSDGKEDHTLAQRVQKVTPKCGSIRFPQWFFEGLTVDGTTVVFPGEGSNSADGGCGFTSDLSGVLMRFLVRLIFEDNDTLKVRIETYAC